MTTLLNAYYTMMDPKEFEQHAQSLASNGLLRALGRATYVATEKGVRFGVVHAFDQYRKIKIELAEAETEYTEWKVEEETRHGPLPADFDNLPREQAEVILIARSV